MSIPQLIFVVPYRDREQHQIFFAKQMKSVLEDLPDDSYKIYYIHQCDTRSFNRGAMKNIGFLVIKQLYPNDYKNITIIFNDVDTMPYTKNLLNYATTKGVIKHFYGYKFTLGGIVSITCEDFEQIGGFPNFWAWGFEDNLLQGRVIQHNLVIDRTQFYPILSKEIIQFNDGVMRIANEDEYNSYIKNNADGFNDIDSLEYTINEQTGFIDITQFKTKYIQSNKNINHDMRKGNKINFGRAPTMKMFM